MAHYSIPKPFASGSVSDWLQKFDICCKANSWTDKVKARKLPTLLEGEALAVWLELSADEQADYAVVRERLTSKLNPQAFVSLDEFHQRKLHPGESATLYVHHLKKLLERAMPTVDNAVRDQLVLHQFVAGLPQEIARQLRATGDTSELNATVEKARLLLSLDSHDSVATVTEETSGDSLISKLKTQVDVLTQQVAALTPVSIQPQAPQQFKVRCFTCGGMGHTKHVCPSRNRRPSSSGNVRCFKCGQWGHMKKDCKQQGNAQGMPAWGSGHPTQR